MWEDETTALVGAMLLPVIYKVVTSRTRTL
jgi:uncharacterized MnhB-related membrane protein